MPVVDGHDIMYDCGAKMGGWGIINVLPYGRNWLHQGCIIAAGKDVIINRRGRRYSW